VHLDFERETGDREWGKLEELGKLGKRETIIFDGNLVLD